MKLRTLNDYSDYQNRIIRDVKKIMREFRTLPHDYVRAFYVLRYGLEQENKITEVQKIVAKNALGFLVKTKKDYLASHINFKTDQYLYEPKSEINFLYLFYLAVQSSTYLFEVMDNETSEHGVYEMNLLMKNDKEYKVLVLPKDIKRANIIIMESQKLREERKRKTIKEQEIQKIETINDNVYDLMYVVPDVNYVRSYELDGYEGRFVLNHKQKFPELAWNNDLKNIPKLFTVQFETILKEKKSAV